MFSIFLTVVYCGYRFCEPTFLQTNELGTSTIFGRFHADLAVRVGQCLLAERVYSLTKRRQKHHMQTQVGIKAGRESINNLRTRSFFRW